MDTITELYHTRGYFDIHGMDVLITTTIITTVMIATGYTNYQSMLLAIRSDWDVYRCNPLIMPFAGVVMPVEGKAGSLITMENLYYCAKKDTAIALSIAVMPIETMMYATVEVLDSIQEGIDVAMRVTQWILNKIGEQMNLVINKLKSIVIPIREMIIYIRDSISKANAVLTTTLYVGMHMYYLIISGTINLMKVMSNLILITTVATLALAAIAFALIATLIGAGAGIPMYIAAATTLAVSIIPWIVIYTTIRLAINSLEPGSNIAKPPPKPKFKMSKDVKKVLRKVKI